MITEHFNLKENHFIKVRVRLLIISFSFILGRHGSGEENVQLDFGKGELFLVMADLK